MTHDNEWHCLDLQAEMIRLNDDGTPAGDSTAVSVCGVRMEQIECEPVPCPPLEPVRIGTLGSNDRQITIDIPVEIDDPVHDLLTDTILVKMYTFDGDEPLRVQRMPHSEIDGLIGSPFVYSWTIVRQRNAGNYVVVRLASDFDRQWSDLCAQVTEQLAAIMPDAGQLEQRQLDAYDPDLEQQRLQAMADYDPVATSWSGDGSRYTPPEGHATPGDDLDSWLSEVSAMLDEEADG